GHAGAERGSAFEPVDEAVASRPGVRPQPERRRRLDVARDQLGRGAEAAGREHDRLAAVERCGVPQSQRLDAPRQPLGESACVEAHSGRERILRLVLDDRCADRPQPVQRVVESLPDELLDALVSGRALAPERLPVRVAPHDAGAEQHRAARPRPLLVDDGGEPELASADSGHQPGHPPPPDDHRSEKLALCSTYSMRTPSGPERNTAKVFAASTVDSTSIPSSSASATASAAESTSTARWFSSGRSLGSTGPGWTSTNAPPTS